MWTQSISFFNVLVSSHLPKFGENIPFIRDCAQGFSFIFSTSFAQKHHFFSALVCRREIYSLGVDAVCPRPFKMLKFRKAPNNFTKTWTNFHRNHKGSMKITGVWSFFSLGRPRMSLDHHVLRSCYVNACDFYTKCSFFQVHNKCEVVRCPSLTAPINGRFEGMECDNRYRSRCGFYCDEGHDLVGSERIKCDISGRWLNVNDDQPAAPVSCQSMMYYLFISKGLFANLINRSLALVSRQNSIPFLTGRYLSAILSQPWGVCDKLKWC